MRVNRYRIKKRYNPKGSETGFFIYSRHIFGRHIEPVDWMGNIRRSRRYRVSRRFATRRGAIRATKNLKLKSDIFVAQMLLAPKQKGLNFEISK